MQIPSGLFRGVIRGNAIELERATGLPEGQQVTVTVAPTNGATPSPGDGIRRSSGGWTDDTTELDQFLDWNRQQCKQSRRDTDK